MVLSSPISVERQAVELARDDSAQLSARIEGTPDTVVWISADTTVVTVDRKGLIRGVGVGETTVTARAEYGEDRGPCLPPEGSASALITVVEP